MNMLCGVNICHIQSRSLERTVLRIHDEFINGLLSYGKPFSGTITGQKARAINVKI